MKKIKVGSVFIKVNAKGQAKETYKVAEWRDGEQVDTGTTKERDIYTMPYQSRNKVFKSSGGKNCFDPSTFSAVSYGWWQFVAKIRGKVVFNDYSYSMTTNGHQGEMKRLLAQLGIKINLFVECSGGLQRFKSQSLKPMYREMLLLELKLTRKGLKQDTIKASVKRVKEIKRDIALARSLGAEFTRQSIADLKLKIQADEIARLEDARQERAARKEVDRERKALLKTATPFELSA